MSAPGRITFAIIVAVLLIDYCYSARIPPRFDPQTSEEVDYSRLKRPFCNAFTGCGRKRSLGPLGSIPDLVKQRQYVDDSQLGGYLDSENTIEDLSRQILSEARLWEAIQDASAELARRKQERLGYGNQ